ncbi:1-deoxy-D-xylulose-5-phosphate reductoisomerase [Labilibaculum euxinus]|uniref:1-deoxy-D-xylulose 5-phosphate reductoisomerase n=1 Tax=Labilibaculum euxinus TaxID=2686357 RepID=A0A7M4D4S1_9BACT|nr:1-deoxy-D-xylulose-5-phosphate reductoisomerase [Labilibaculum euxinus]MUP37650.1 1-deoxy-D-xylulose-5-phosphate reductoisomerase [Labilibaculum euxinus]MVB06855.1 1-deoxy-D-xylulose-5-phosphate reductoisomerase [Labilibaculum euxinus]
MSKHIAILGSTGSIGTQTLEVVEANPDDFIVDVLTANNNIELLIQQAKKFHPDVVVIACEEKYTELSEALKNEPIKVYAGIDAIAQVVQMSAIDVVVTAMVGYSGLLPTIKAIEAKKNIALANKETLVVAGEIIQKLALENGVNIYPVDSEHSAIFQCLSGEFDNSIEKIYLTASGGPFRGKDKKFLENVSSKQALQHPNWDMGAKITIDSASMMNKGFEAIEAKWLFDLKASQIDVIVHPQSIVHSIVQFEDGSMKAQMGLPDMKLPIQFALTYPKRLKTDFPRFNFLDYPNLSFEAADSKNFKNLNLAFQAMEKGGNLPCIINAANEIVVDAFLRDEVGFLRMSDIIEDCMHKTGFIKNPTYEDYVLTDKEARKLALSML